MAKRLQRYWNDWVRQFSNLHGICAQLEPSILLPPFHAGGPHLDCQRSILTGHLAKTLKLFEDLHPQKDLLNLSILPGLFRYSLQVFDSMCGSKTLSFLQIPSMKSAK